MGQSREQPWEMVGGVHVLVNGNFLVLFNYKRRSRGTINELPAFSLSETQSRFSFCERGKCAMHGRSMEGSRRLIHAAAEALRLPLKQHVQRWLHNQCGLPPKLFAARALHHANLLRKLLRHVRDERSLPPKHSLLCAALHCTTQTY